MPRDLRAFVRDSILVLEREAPAFYASFAAALRGRRLLVSGDGDPFTLAFSTRAVEFVRSDGSAELCLRVDRPTILALVEADLALEDALRLDRLMVRGNLENVVDLFDGLSVYLRGAVRCPSFPALLSAFRTHGAGVSREVRYEPEAPFLT